MMTRTLAAGDGRPAFAAAAARGPAHSLGRAAAGAARAGAEPRATARVSDALPPSVPRLARRGGRAHRVAAAAGPRPQRGGPRTLRGGPALPAQQRGRGGVPAPRPGALLPASAPRPQPHLQLLRRAGLQRLGGGARREWLGCGKEPNTGAGRSFPDLLRDFFRMVLQEAACGLGDGGCVAGAARQLPDRDLCGRLVSHVFTNFGKGIRYVSFEQYGRDTRSWVGHYGALVTHSSVRVRIRLS
ncbi:F-box only protein 17 isoform 11-T13 [Megaptera novaeangliae]